MSRILGKVEDGNGESQYFIHCDTGGSSFGPLFATPALAWLVYDKDGLDGLYTASPAISRDLRVISKSLAYGREFSSDGKTYGEPVHGLATADRLLSPFTQYEQELSFMQFDGVLHLATHIEIGFGIDCDVPLCDKGRDLNESDEHFSLEHFFGKPIVLCEKCIAEIMNWRK
jgi:hypothetical protein